MRNKKFLLAVFGLAVLAGLLPARAEYYKAIEMAESGPIEQNRFYPRWGEAVPLSEIYYGVPVSLYRPPEIERKIWKGIVRIFLEDLFDQEQGAQARIFAPQGLINPVVLHDGREYFQAFWKDKVNSERHVTDNIDIVAMANGHKWAEVWVRFVEVGASPNIKYSNYIAMLFETPPNDEPYLADCKVLGRAPTGLQDDLYMRKILGLRKLSAQPAF